MASLSASPSQPAGSYNSKGMRFLVGLVCLVGFLSNVLILLLPPNLGNVEWRVEVVRRISDTSILLLFGSALLIESSSKRSQQKLYSKLSMGVGLVFLLVCLVTIADGVKLHQQALSTIGNQESQIQTQIRNAQADPSAIRQDLTADDLKRASEQLASQSRSLKRNARNTVVKAGATSVSNLIVMGLGLIGLGRYGMSMSRAK